MQYFLLPVRPGMPELTCILAPLLRDFKSEGERGKKKIKSKKVKGIRESYLEKYLNYIF